VEHDGLQVKLHFFDLAGDQMYYEVRREFYRDTQAVLLVFDVANRASFTGLDMWVKELQQEVCSSN
jgi:DnaJ family protein C protein 27